MKKPKLIALAVMIALPVLAAAAMTAAALATRSDCPGTKICPVTGKEICADRCPLPCCARRARQR